MKLIDYANTQPRGTLVSLARAIGGYPSDLSDWMSGKRPVPVGRCLAIEQATQGQVTRQDLRPDDYWLIWPDLPPKQPQAASAKLQQVQGVSNG